MHQKLPSRRKLAGWAAYGTLLYLLLRLLLELAAAGKTSCPICGRPVFFAFFRFCCCPWR